MHPRIGQVKPTLRASTIAKFERVADALRGRRVLVALSGGVDSSVLALVSRDSAEETVLLNVVSQTIPRIERDAARSVARELGLNLHSVAVDWLATAELVANPKNRCYLCKRILAGMWVGFAEREGLDLTVEGTGASDLEGRRPGYRALREFGVVSPLLEAGIVKNEIREFARARGLSVADRPSRACLATRFPYGTRITAERLRMVESVEDAVRKIFGVVGVRARFHGNIVRIEVDPDDRDALLDSAKMDLLHDAGRRAGFQYVTIDVRGYRTGSMDIQSPESRQCVE